MTTLSNYLPTEYNEGDSIIVSPYADPEYKGVTGVITKKDYRKYMNEFLYHVKLDTGSTVRLVAHEIEPGY